MNGFDEEDVGIGYRDLLMGVVGLFAMIIVAVSLWVNDPKEQAVGQPPPGDIIVSVFWPNGNIDVDTWLDGPGESKPVGFSHKSGFIWNLLRDDLGTTSDILPTNFENAYTRGAPPGRYTINLHCYHCDGPVPVAVKVEKRMRDGTLSTIYEGTTILEYNWDQKTVISFVLDSDGNVTEKDTVQRKLI